MPVCCRHPHEQVKHFEIGIGFLILSPELLRRAVMETTVEQGAVAAAA